LNLLIKISSPNNTTHEIQARGSYISVAASITTKFKCCITGDTHTTNHTNPRNRETGLQQHDGQEYDENDVEIAIDNGESYEGGRSKTVRNEKRFVDGNGKKS
jgi:hypothetical protein